MYLKEKWSILVSVSLFCIESPSWQLGFWGFCFFSLHKPGMRRAWRQRRFTWRPPSSWVFPFFLLLIINSSHRDVESLFYYISSKKKEIMLDLMLEERDCFFPLTRLRLMFGFIPRKSRGFWWIHAVLFFGTIQLFSSAAMDNGGKKGTQREFQVLFNHGTFLFVVDVFGRSFMCPAWIFTWPASLWIERRRALRTL